MNVKIYPSESAIFPTKVTSADENPENEAFTQSFENQTISLLLLSDGHCSVLRYRLFQGVILSLSGCDTDFIRC